MGISPPINPIIIRINPTIVSTNPTTMFHFLITAIFLIEDAPSWL